MAAKKIYPVRFAGLRGTWECDAAFRTVDPEQLQRWLKHAHDNRGLKSNGTKSYVSEVTT